MQITFSQTPEPRVQTWVPPASSSASCSLVGHWLFVSFSVFTSNSLGFCSCLCISCMLPISLVPLCLFLFVHDLHSLLFFCFGLLLPPLHRSSFPTLCIISVCAAHSRIQAGPLTCLVCLCSLPDRHVLHRSHHLLGPKTAPLLHLQLCQTLLPGSHQVSGW